jgi:hypothetical protein
MAQNQTLSRGRSLGGEEEILDAERDTLKRTAIGAGPERRVCRLGRRQRGRIKASQEAPQRFV